MPLHRKCLPGCGPVVTLVTLRLLSCIVSCPDSRFRLRHHLVRVLPVFLRGGGPPSPFLQDSPTFSNFGTSVRSTLGTQTLMSMRQFLEDAEKDSKKETSTCDAELNVKNTDFTRAHEAQTADDKLPEVPDKIDKEVIRAFRMLFEDFEDRIQYQEEVPEDSTSETEESSQEPVVHTANVLPCN